MNASKHLLRSLFVMASMVEARDPYTGGHLWRVSQFSRLLAIDTGLSDDDQARVALGGFLHDLGKIAVPDAILNKPAALSEDEFAVIRTHPEVGHRLLHSHPLAELADSAVRAHHERADGSGYPRGLSLAQITIDARIVAICDAFDAMTSTRSYRRGMPVDQALMIIREHLGSQFDSKLGAHFIALGEAGRLDHIVGHSEAGIPLQSCPICGPTIVIRRDQRHGDQVYCRACGGEARVVREDGKLDIEPTGGQGKPADLAPDVDDVLLDRLVDAADSLLRSQP